MLKAWSAAEKEMCRHTCEKKLLMLARVNRNARPVSPAPGLGFRFIRQRTASFIDCSIRSLKLFVDAGTRSASCRMFRMYESRTEQTCVRLDALDRTNTHSYDHTHRLWQKARERAYNRNFLCVCVHVLSLVISSRRRRRYQIVPCPQSPPRLQTKSCYVTDSYWSSRFPHSFFPPSRLPRRSRLTFVA